MPKVLPFCFIHYRYVNSWPIKFNFTNHSKHMSKLHQSFTKHLTCIERNKTTNCDQEMTNKEKKQETRSTKVKDVMKNKEIKIISLEK